MDNSRDVVQLSFPASITPKLPMSKSVEARELVLDFVLTGSIKQRRDFLLEHYDVDEFPQDIVVLLEALIELEQAKAKSSGDIVLNCCQSGTALRFLSVLAIYQEQPIVLEVASQLARRPMARLVNLLEEMGAIVIQEVNSWRIIPAVKPKPIHTINTIGWESSQFVSGLLLAIPLSKEVLHVQVPKDMPSRSYVMLTIDLLRRRGFPIEQISEDVWSVSPVIGYQHRLYPSQLDWSSATYWMQLLVSSEDLKQVVLAGLTLDSMQPDARSIGFFERLGIKVEESAGAVTVTKDEFDVSSEQMQFDIAQNIDLFVPLVLALVRLGQSFTLFGTKHLQFKESHRIKAVVEGLQHIGYTGFNESTEHFSWNGSYKPNKPSIKHISSYDDHRVAMGFAIFGSSMPNLTLTISDPNSVTKSYPHFWQQLYSLSVT